MGEYLAFIVGRVIGAGLMIFVAASVVNIYLKNLYLSVFIGYGFLLLLRIIIGGEIYTTDLIADLIAIVVVLLILIFKQKKDTRLGK